MTTVYIITGANRGIGRALADIVLLRPNHKLYALVRDPSHETSQSLLTQQTAADSSVDIIRYDASNTDSAATAYEEIISKHGVNKIDTIVANAGAIGATGSSTDISATQYQETFVLNTLGPIMLFNAMLPLMRQSTSPKFIAISSGVGSTTNITRMRAGKALAYGMSKAALNHAICKMNQDYHDIVFELLTPRPTKTGFGGSNVDWSKIPDVRSVEEVASGLMQRIDEAKKTEAGENLVFRDFEGQEIPW